MSFAFNAAGTPKEAVAQVGEFAAANEQMPNALADAINEQLAGLPDEAEVTLVTHGHVGRNPGQMAGQIVMSATIDFRVEKAEQPDADPTAEQPGPSRFPEGFTGDDAPGRPAGAKDDAA
jgi:hypothetical protein